MNHLYSKLTEQTQSLSNMNKVVSSEDFYDHISNDYNDLLNNIPYNERIRKEVAEHFTDTVKGKNVMDFGGGTGADLPWLKEAGYQIYFCEPSVGMRKKAREWANANDPVNLITFLENENADFTKWSSQPPAYTVMDAVLANFAVFNCIKDLKILFEKLFLIIKPGGYLFTTVIDTRLHRLILNYPLKFILKSGSTPKTTNYYNGISHEVYLHPLHLLKRYAAPYFKAEEIKNLKGYGFLSIKWRRL